MKRSAKSNVASESKLAHDVKVANIKLHSASAKTYDLTQPHFREENVARVSSIIDSLAEAHPRGRLLDIGCGTGFMLNIAERRFAEALGVDITPAMLRQIHGPRVSRLLLADAFALPFRNGTIDVCTSYSFLHHLADYKGVLAEVRRCLKPGGVYYNDQDPNFYAFTELRQLEIRRDTSPELRAELESVNKSDVPAVGKNVSDKVASMAEYHRKVKNGIREEDVESALRAAGFRNVEFRYHWYFAQGQLLHGVSKEAADTVDRHLKSLLPVSRTLYKYFGFVATK